MHHTAKKFDRGHGSAKAYDVYYSVSENGPAGSRFIAGGSYIYHEAPIHTCDGPMDMLLLDSEYCDMCDADTFTHTTVLAVVGKDDRCLRYLDSAVTSIIPARDVDGIGNVNYPPESKRVLLVDSANSDLLVRSPAFDGEIMDKSPVSTFSRVDIDLGDSRFILSYNCECLGPYRSEEPGKFIVYMPIPEILGDGDEIYSVAFGRDLSEEIEIVDLSGSKLLSDIKHNRFLKITVTVEV